MNELPNLWIDLLQNQTIHKYDLNYLETEKLLRVSYFKNAFDLINLN